MLIAVHIVRLPFSAFFCCLIENRGQKLDFLISLFILPQNKRINNSSDILDMIELVPVTRAHSLEKLEIKKLTGEMISVAQKGYKIDFIQSVFGSVNWVVFSLFQMICLFFTGYLCFQGMITDVGEIALYQTYFTSLLGYVNSVIALMPVLSRGAEAIISIGEILTSHDIEDNDGKKKLKTLEGDYF